MTAALPNTSEGGEQAKIRVRLSKARVEDAPYAHRDQANAVGSTLGNAGATNPKTRQFKAQPKVSRGGAPSETSGGGGRKHGRPAGMEIQDPRNDSALTLPSVPQASRLAGKGKGLKTSIATHERDTSNPFGEESRKHTITNSAAKQMSLAETGKFGMASKTPRYNDRHEGIPMANVNRSQMFDVGPMLVESASKARGSADSVENFGRNLFYQAQPAKHDASSMTTKRFRAQNLLNNEV